MSLPLSIAALLEASAAREAAGDWAEALSCAQQALEAAQAAGDAGGTAAAMVAVARVRHRLGQYELAQNLAAEALRLAPARSALSAEAWQVLGNCAADTDSLALAEAHYRTAEDLARETGHLRAQVAALQGLAGGAYYPRGRFDLALATAAEARRLAEMHGRTEWLAYPQIIIAIIHQESGRRQEALDALAGLARLALPGSPAQGYHLCISAGLALEDGDGEGALALLTRARGIAESTGEPWINAAVRLGMSRYHRLAGREADARAWADDALAFARRLGNRHDQGKALIERGRAAWLCGDDSAAEGDLREAVALLDAVGAGFDLARGRLVLAALLGRQQRDEAPAAWLAAARGIIEGGYAFLLEQERGLAFPLLAAHQASPDPGLVRACGLLLEHLRRVPAPALRVTALGRWEVRQAAIRAVEPALRQRRGGELLALLLLAPNHALAAEEAMEALFPDKAPAAAQMLLHHATSALRRALEPELPDRFPSRYLEVEGGRIALALPPGSWTDLEAFEAHCGRGEWEQAVALYGGDLLPAFRYADWALAARERLALLYQRALLAVAEARLAGGRSEEALAACRRLLDLEPWHEGAVLLGMRACVALNDVAAARRLYLRLEQNLAEDLDTSPQDELRAYYLSLTPPAT